MGAVIEVRGIVNRFGSQVVHDGLDLEVRAGEVFSIVGGSGSGKSVLLRTMLGLQRPAGGTVRIEGHEVTHQPEQALRAVKRRYGVMFQRGALFSSLTVAQNVELPIREHFPVTPELAGKLALLRVRMVGLAADAASKYPAELSGGMTKRVALANGESIAYDFLILATGSQILPESLPGLTGEGWRTTAHDFYTLEGATALRDALSAWPGGKLVINVVDMPIKCPVAPLEFAFLADWFFTKRGIRDKVEITYVTPLDGPFTKPVCNRELSHLFKGKEIHLQPEFNTGTVDGANGRLIAYDEREIPFDLLVAIPLHGGAEYVGRSPGLGDDLGFVLTDQHTLQESDIVILLAAVMIGVVGLLADLIVAQRRELR